MSIAVMSQWCAVAYGALDLTSQVENVEGTACAVTAIYPAEPILLTGEVANLWLRLINGPVADGDLSVEQRNQIREFHDFGIASPNLDHPARVHKVAPPWLESFQHELVYALIASLAREAGIDAVFIKGPFLKVQGLRTRAHSADVDVLVDPQHVEHLAEIVSSWGWTSRPAVLEGTRIRHSITLAPSSWGCEVDIHWRMPGYAKPDNEAFALIHGRSESHDTASVSIAVPDAPTNAVLGALHALRPRYTDRTQLHLVHIARSFIASGGEQTVPIAQQLQADLVLYEVLSTEFPGAVPRPTYAVPQNWQWRSKQGQFRSYMSALKQIPWVERPAVTWRLVWPPPHFFTTSGEVKEPTRVNIFKARVNRLWRGLVKTIPVLQKTIAKRR